MDDSLLQELDSVVSNLGSEKIWKREIDGTLLWFSPINYESQMKINEMVMNDELGNSVVAESKKLALCHSIVGINNIDLTKYREGSHFPMPGPNNRTVKVSLSKYLLEKVKRWDSDFVDLAFDMFADVMETHKKELNEGIVFENSKEPTEELSELEGRVAELRLKLGLPQLIEGDKVEKADPDSYEEPSEEEMSKTSQKELDEAMNRSRTPIDPFSTLHTEEDDNGVEEVLPPVSSPAVNRPPQVIVESGDNHPLLRNQAQNKAPSAIEKAIQEKASLVKEEARKAAASIDKELFSATPSVPDEVIDAPEPKPDPRAKIKIDRQVKHQSRNPRFQKQR